MKGKAIVWPKPLTVEVKEVEVPAVKDNEVMLETAYSSVSQSSEANWLSSDEAHFVLGTTFPFTPGYAAAGIVREVGKEVKDYKPGDRVICRQPAGCHAQYVVTTEEWLFHIADSVAYSDAVFFNLGMTSLFVLERSGVRFGDGLAIIGQGPVGLMATSAARSIGAYPIVTLDLEEDRRKKSLEMGADYSIDSRDTKAYNRVKNEIFENGAPITLDMTGSNAGINQALDLAAPFSTVVLSSGHSNGMQEMHYGKIFTKCLDVKGSLVMADMDLQTKCDHIFLRMLERGQIQVPDYQNEIFQPEEAPEIYARVLKHDRGLKNPLFVWNASL